MCVKQIISNVFLHDTFWATSSPSIDYQTALQFNSVLQGQYHVQELPLTYLETQKRIWIP